MMQQDTVADLTAPIALEGARAGAELGMPMAGSNLLATVRAFDATLWTQDMDFQGIGGVQYVCVGAAATYGRHRPQTSGWVSRGS